MNETTYIGDELELFSHAHNWKNYWSNQTLPYLGSQIMEVGAGLGGTTQLMLPKVPNLERWVCLEPDPQLANQIKGKIQDVGPNKDKVEVIADTLEGFAGEDQFDSILYIDVIEHIEDDAGELKRAMDRLKPGGHLIIIVPAHNFLYNEFDKAIGHYRRYNKQMLREVLPDNAKIVVNRYLDTLGLSASMMNKWFLKQSYPSRKQIDFWDKTIVPVSRILDPILFYNLGKSVLLISQKKA